MAIPQDAITTSSPRGQDGIACQWYAIAGSRGMIVDIEPPHETLDFEGLAYPPSIKKAQPRRSKTRQSIARHGA